ncbi:MULTISPECIES: hypothetical protein [unclassified Shewanella]|uniref:hypothetical protein n=1 Tax=unclassified Shewanella TaxID=196818 RepID=UPI0006D67A06|nr:hypothetical protein [Shewanella sp. P1-14-1]KPZ68123.1 hypothetical protein AN944_03703 [Shewanella sp. P1-14-1]
MKLIGSRVENEFRAELEESKRSLLSESKLSLALKSKGHSIDNAYVLNWIPEQYEDIYLVIIDGSYLVKVELDRQDSNVTPVFDEIDLSEYKHELSRIKQVQLMVALDLAKKT